MPDPVRTILRNSFTSVCGLPLILLTVVSAQAQSAPNHPVVVGYERFHDEAPEVAGGKLLLGELNCLSCHEASAAVTGHVPTKQAPILTNVGKRVRPEYLQAFLTDPQAVKPGTTMPNLFAGVSPSQRAEQVKALAHFLASTGKLLEAGPITPAITRGDALFHQVGCVACHAPQHDKTPKLANSVPLPSELEKKYSLPGLAAFLKNPLHVRPSARMPSLNLTDEEARDIASYLLRNLEVEGLVEFAYYEGSWQELPDFSKLKPKAVGKTASFDVNVGRGNQFGIVFKALFQIDRKGEYTFHLGSDDGSRLRIDGKEVTAAPGIHAFSFKSGKTALQAGVHELEVEYFEQGGEQELRVEFEGPGTKRQALEYALTSHEQDKQAEEEFVVKPELAKQGKRLFGSLGCAACHELRIENKRMSPAGAAKPFAALDINSGCLADSPTNSPDFHLGEVQRASLTMALDALQQPHLPPRQPTESISTTLTALNCYACHERGDRGGVEDARNALFQSNQPEMGDEGRIPPHLNGVGAKLQPNWLKKIFDQGSDDRPYMFTRMPKFGSQNVGHLIEAFATVDPPVADHGVAADFEDRRMKATGRKLVGSQGFSCIKCHTWGDVPATGIQSIDMVTMTQRLQENWFHQYMLNPAQYRPGTRMPAAWPQGQVLLPNVLDGQAMTQIHAIWTFLSDGSQAARPIGLGKNPIILTAFDQAIIYRNFIQGAGARAIGVGYPEKVNQAFDANDLRIALLWHGAFMDASKHWIGRGPGFQPPLGDNVLKLPEGVSFARLDNPDASWPKQSAKELGYQFRGYRLGEARRPTFRYTIGEVTVEDEFVPLSDKQFAPARRRLTLTTDAPIDNLWYRAAVGKSITMQDDFAVIEDSWRVRVTDARRRKSNGKAELLVPVEFVHGKATIVQEYHW